MSKSDWEPDIESVVSCGDLHYSGTVESSDEGIPLGNGRMASLVWTSPWSIKMQINRVDVYANNAASQSFNQRNTDYSYGCAQVDIDLGTAGGEVFPAVSTEQHLSVYDGLITIEGDGVVVRVVSSQEDDLFCIEIEDNRTTSSTITAKLTMMRPAEVYERNHSAVSQCIAIDTTIALRQVFRESDYYCSSAVAIAATGGTVATRYADETGGRKAKQSSQRIPGIGQAMESEVTLSVTDPTESGSRNVTIFLTSAASFEQTVDTVSLAVDILKKVLNFGFESVKSEAASWWRRFWSGGYVHLSSSDGTADLVQTHYTYFLYLMACCSRGRFAPRYGCMLFSTHGDKRAWGAQQWWTNLSLYYRGLYPTGKFELLNGCLNHYYGVKDSCALAAAQQWNANGIYFPETIWFDGLAPLPEDIAEEMRDLYLCRKPWDLRSKRFDEYASVRHPHSSRWNWIGHGKWIEGVWTYGYNAVPPFSPVNHFFASGGEIAMLFWKRYEYTRNANWLRECAYPIIKGVAEFLCSFPNFRRESDGKYHVSNVNQGEHLRGARDAFDYLSAVMGVLPVAAAAAAVLGVDGNLQTAWLEIAENVAPLPTSDDPDSVEVGAADDPVRFTDARNPVVDGKPRPGIEEFNSRFYDYDLINLESNEREPGPFGIALNTFNHKYPKGIDADTSVWVMSSLPVIAAKLGRAADFQQAVVNIINVVDPATDFCDFEGQGSRGALPNRMTNREGVNAIGAQRLGTTVYAVNEALCQSDPAAPGGKSVIRLFPAWPREWDASFSLRVRGGFSVTSEIQGGVVSGVVVRPETNDADEEIYLRNPWPGKRISITRSHGNVESMDGELLVIPMDGEITISPE